MSGIWAYLGPSTFTNGLSNVAHRGRFETLRQMFESPAGTILLQQSDHTSEAHDRPVPERPARKAERYAIAFDGCLYNREELAQLAAEPLGKEATDAQILLAAFERLGMKFLDRIDGAFVCVIWDNKEKQLYAVRDRFGLRPLYIYADRMNLAFASEIKQFFNISDARARLHTGCALDFLISGLTDHRIETMFEDVYRVPAGAMIQLDLRVWKPGNALPEFNVWYQLPNPGSLEISETEAVERFRHLLSDAVSVRWQRLAPHGLCLSGGLDSASIAGILASAKCRSEDVDELATFKACFGDEEFDETPLLKSIIAMTGVTNYQTHCTFTDALDLVESLAWHLDEPFSRASLTAQWMLFEQAAGKGMRSMLDGQGSDEQLCGYTSMIREHLAYLGSSEEPSPLPATSSRSSLMQNETAEGDLKFFWLSREQQQATLGKYAVQPGTKKRSLGQLCMSRMSQGDLPMMMRQNDRLGAAHGIETHVPFMAHQVVEFSIALGDKYKFVNHQSKYLLRRAMDGVVPREILEHYYKGSYSKLEEGWLRTAHEQRLVKTISDTAHEWPEIFDEEGVRVLMREYARADKETLLLLWRILCFGTWARKFNVTL